MSTPARDLAGKLERLPKWAQSHIQKLESDLRHSEKQNREMKGEVNSPTEVFIWEGTEMIPLPRRTQVRFLSKPGDGGKYFDVSIRDGRLRIYGSRWYAIHPSASNTIDINIED